MSKKKITWTLEKRKLEQLNPYEHNPRKLTEKGMADLKKSIDKFGLAEPIIINTDNTIIGGHARYFTLLKDKNILFADCYVPDITLTPEEVKELNIRLNKNIAGEFDLDILAAAFEFDKLVDWGFAEDELDASKWGVQKTEEELDDVPEPQKEAVSKFGDIFLLDGKHRVMCGDSTKKEDVELLMDGVKADMVFTDPPYGMKLDTDYSGMSGGDRKGKKYDKVIGDNEDFKPELIHTIFACFDYCEEIFIWGVDYYFDLIPNFKSGSLIVWDKTLQTNGDAGYNSEFELCWSKTPHKKEVLHFNWFRYFGLSSQDIKTREHPTQKPLQVITPFIEKYSQNIIADLFLGSGSTLIACEQTNRICYGMEIDPIYIDVILRRYYNLYPEKRIECLTRKDFNFSDLFKTDAKN